MALATSCCTLSGLRSGGWHGVMVEGSCRVIRGLFEGYSRVIRVLELGTQGGREMEMQLVTSDHMRV